MGHIWKVPAVPLTDEDLFGEEKRVEEASEQFIIFRLEDEWFAFSSIEVREVLKVKEITYLPGMPSHIAGVTSIRGTIVLVIEPKQLLQLPHSSGTQARYILVVNHNDYLQGLLADEVTEVLSISRQSLEPPPALLQTGEKKRIQNTFYWKGHLIAVLQAQNLIESQIYKGDIK